MSSEELYVTLVARFWERQTLQPLKPVDVTLYLHLLHTCYSLNWKTPFYHGNDFICAALGGVDTKTLIGSRDRLMKRQEIGFISGKHRKDLSEYDLLDLAKMPAIKGGIFPPLPENKGGKIPVIPENKGGDFPPLSSQKKPIAAGIRDKGGKSPHNSKSIYKGKGKEQQENTHTTDADPLAFEVFWDLYQKKVDHKRSKLKWDSLSAEQRTKALARIPAYVLSTPNKKFRKDPLTYLNGENWEDEDLPPADSKPAPGANQTTAPVSQAAKIKRQAEYVPL